MNAIPKIKQTLKYFIKKIPIAFTQNQQYDRDTKRIIQKICDANSNCIDIGCHKGEVLDIMIKYAPQGQHIAFEPIPSFAENLRRNYSAKDCIIHQVALSNQTGSSSFNYVVSNPAYSGLIKRKYDRDYEEDQNITVQKDLLDNIASDKKYDLIKIDVEGGELQVLEGAINCIKYSHPVILFEHGKGASDCYKTTPQMILDFFNKVNYKVSLLSNFLSNKKELTCHEFIEQYSKERNFFFVAHP